MISTLDHLITSTLKIVLLTTVFIACSELSIAQLIEIKPVSPHYPSNSKALGKKNSQSRIQSHTRLTLPFFDDFSTRDTAYVDTALWVNSNSVNISSSFGVNAPSLNVLVFNGLDSTGLPYNSVDKFLNGYTDKLVSTRIDLSGISGADRDSVFLNFYYQWRANGEAPDKTDYLEVSFLDKDSSWVVMSTIYGSDIGSSQLFYPAIVKVNDDDFFHDDFQFRIRSFGRLSGAYDTWAVDYVYLNKSRRNDFFSFPDRAIASSLSPLYGSYYAVPYTHIIKKNIIDSLSFIVTNLRGGDALNPLSEEPVAFDFNAYGTITEYTGGVASNQEVILRENAATDFLVLELSSVSVKTDNFKGLLPFSTSADSVDIKIRIDLDSKDESDKTRTPFDSWSPIDFKINDTVYATYPLRDYYAYDDGTAEYSVKLTQPGVRLAYRFEMPIDTGSIYGIRMYFPYFSGELSEPLDLLIYGDNNGKPGDQPLLTLSSRTIYKSKNNQFTEYLLGEPLFLNDSVFYVGYKQSESENILLGIDKSNDTGNQVFIYYNTTWEQNTLVHGSLMVRPLFGKGSGVITGLPPWQEHEVMVRPNPNQGVFQIVDEVQDLNIIDVAGKSITWHSTLVSSGTSVSLDNPSAGFYIVRWRNQRGYQAAKILVKN